MNCMIYIWLWPLVIKDRPTKWFRARSVIPRAWLSGAGPWRLLVARGGMIRPPPSLFVPSGGCDPPIIVNFNCQNCSGEFFGDEASACVFLSYIIVSHYFLQHGLLFSLCITVLLSRSHPIFACSEKWSKSAYAWVFTNVQTYSTWDLFCVRGYGCRGCSYYFVLICVRQVTSLYDR